MIDQNYIVLEHLSVKSHKDERREFALNPTAVCSIDDNAYRVKRLTQKALITLLSIEAQNNISTLIKEN